jgi:tRNA nucleotidyltransferase (CCA-adding enzyme)
LKAIDPNLGFDAAAAKSLKRLRVPPKDWHVDNFELSDLGFILWLMNLPMKNASAVSDRLRLPLPLRRAVLSASKLRPGLKTIPKLAPSAVVAQLEKEPVLALYALFLDAPNAAVAKTLEGFVSKWQYVHPRANGNTLRKKGLKPGPAYSKILTRLRAAWLDGEIKNEKQERALLDELIDEHR